MKKKLLMFMGVTIIGGFMIFSCTMVDKCCGGGKKTESKETACGSCGKASCDKSCASNPASDTTQLNK